MSDNAGTGIGASVVRKEDRRLLTGRSRFTDDINLPGMAWGTVVRSPHAHARIAGVDVADARTAPGVLAVLTGADVIADGLDGLPCRFFPVPAESPNHRPLQQILATGKVRHVGDRVVFVVAETLAEAKSAAELIAVDYEPLPAVTLADALKEGAPKVWDEAGNNISFKLERGNAPAVDEQFGKAAYVTSLAVVYPRITANSIEPRSVAGSFVDYGMLRAHHVPDLVSEYALIPAHITPICWA
jgi:carbon-monoxide dehydrogenase large subunit